jgi:hypothetical protein
MAFIARLQPLKDYLAEYGRSMDAEAFKQEKKKLAAAFKAVYKANRDVKKDLAAVESAKGELLAKLRVDDPTFVSKFGDFALWLEDTDRAKIAAGTETRFPHIAALTDSDSVILPVAFAVPVRIELKFRAAPFPAVSAQSLLKELALVDSKLKTEPDFVLATPPKFLKLESPKIIELKEINHRDAYFWEKSALCVLRRVANLAIESKLPAFIDTW